MRQRQNTAGAFTPLPGKVLVELDPRGEASGGGIIIPEKFREPEQWATVRAVGTGCAHLDPGERCLVLRTSGTAFVKGGREYVVIEEKRIRAKVTSG